MKITKVECIDELKQEDWVYMVGIHEARILLKVICIDNGKFGFETVNGAKLPQLINSDELLSVYNTLYKIGE